MRKGEKVCFTCGDSAPKKTKGAPFAKRFARWITFTFLASIALTGFSWFSDRTPPFSACLAASVILLFVKRTADQIAGQRS